MKNAFLLVCLLLVGFSPNTNSRSTPSPENALWEIQGAIRSVQPWLAEEKYTQYASYIWTAARYYQVDPFLLVAIAQQETSFRANLPEGRAGELGICQIQKIWLKNKAFIEEFGIQELSDLKSPSKNFFFAAWILKSLKDKYPHVKTPPWWTYYNARSLRPRKRYFAKVNRRIQRISRARRWMASN